MASYDTNPYRAAMLASALRDPDKSQNTAPSGGSMPIVGRGLGGLGNMGSGGGYSQPNNSQQQSSNPISPQSANNIMKYVKGLQGGGATAAAGEQAMPAMMAGGGSDLGSMGLMQGSVSFPGAEAASAGAGSGGGGFMSGLSNLFGGGGGASAGGGAASSGGGLAALAALSYLGDKEMNESKGSIINADKLNNAGTIGDSGIGIRFGDFANGFNPATWLSDPKKAGKALVNAFTFGIGDKLF
jgi:hypothetical protein